MNRILVLLLLTLLSSVSRGYAEDNVKVLKVIDANTILIYQDFQTKYVHLAGVKAPPATGGKSSMRYSHMLNLDSNKVLSVGKEAKQKVEALVKPNDYIQIKLENQQNSIGNNAGYIYLKDGKMLNEEVIKNGYGVVTAKDANYKNRLMDSYNFAKENNMGLWKKQLKTE